MMSIIQYKTEHYKTDCYKTTVPETDPKVFKTSQYITRNYSQQQSFGQLYLASKAYWKLDEESGTRYDSIGNYDLTAVNSPGFEAGIINNASTHQNALSQYYAFSGLDLGASGSFAIFGWAKHNTAVLGDNKAWFFRWRTSDKLYFTGNANSGSQSSFLFLVKKGGVNQTIYFTGLCSQTVNNYFFYCLSYDGTDILRARILSEASGGIDETRTKSIGSGGINSSPSDTIYIASNTGANELEGSLDETCMLENYVIDSSDEEALFNNGNGMDFDTFKYYRAV